MFCSYGLSKSTNDFSCLVEPITQFWILDFGFGIWNSIQNPRSAIRNRSVSVPVLDGVFEERIHRREKRPAFKLTEVVPQPKSADSYRRDNVHPAHIETSALEPGRVDSRRRGDQPEHVEHAHEQYEQRHPYQRFRPP